METTLNYIKSKSDYPKRKDDSTIVKLNQLTADTSQTCNQLPLHTSGTLTSSPYSGASSVLPSTSYNLPISSNILPNASNTFLSSSNTSSNSFYGPHIGSNSLISSGSTSLSSTPTLLSSAHKSPGYSNSLSDSNTFSSSSHIRSNTRPSNSNILSGPTIRSPSRIPVPNVLDKFPSFLFNTPSIPAVVSSRHGNQASPSLPVDTTTFSQFAPKNLPVVRHAFHNIGGGSFQTKRLSVGSSSLRPNITDQPSVNSNIETELNNNTFSDNRSSGPNVSFINPAWPPLVANQRPPSVTPTTTTIVDGDKRSSFPWSYEPPLF